MLIATFNVNSVRAHIENILEWLRAFRPDVALLQEIKCETDAFPKMLFDEAGYNSAAYGQKSYNGVAILARDSIEDVETGLPTFKEDPQARYIEALIGGRLRVANLYAPNGDPVGTEKFSYKLEWMRRFNEHAAHLARLDEEVVIGGDFNVIKTDAYAYNPKLFKDSAVMQPEPRTLFYEAVDKGLADAYATLNPDKVEYTYFDYRGNTLAKDNGLVLDYFLTNKNVKLEDAGVDKSPRARPHASDHAPLWIEIK
ncbi:MAG: exodeoxyribonuclease III [Rickettsiales bacterium]|jgi:exodeoxyribonuclease-3|nr:exodeoxyribonuclease III [Rickettsiales bacterium]